ncbi:MAG: histidine phosphatase family protein [Thermoanaerobaculia bacterium]
MNSTTCKRFALAAALVALAPALLPAQESVQPPSARTIILVRHGAYTPDPADSSPGPGLSPIGVAQAQLAAARLAGMPGRFDAIYSSPMTRAHETARVIAAAMPGAAVQVVPQFEECTPRPRRKEILDREKPESMKACAAKLDALFAKHFVPAAGAERRELIVCHGNVTRYLVTRALGVDTEAWLEMSIGHASLTQIRIEPDGRFKVISVGDTGHIPPNLLTGATGMSEKSLAVPK